MTLSLPSSNGIRLHPTLNSETDTLHISAGSHKKVWWLGECGHEWEAEFRLQNKSKNCPVCIGRRILSGFNDVATTHPKLIEEWHPQLNKITPSEITSGSETKIWWICKNEHVWEASLASRARRKNNCPYCTKHKTQTGKNDLQTLKPDLAAQWHPTLNSISATQITLGSHRKVWWLGDCGHEWEAIIKNRVKGSGCPYCAGKKPSIANNLATAYPDLVKEWDRVKNDDIPENMTPHSNKKVWWKCPSGHSYQSRVADRTAKGGCSKCSATITRPEKEILTILRHFYPDTIHQDRKVLGGKELDFFIPSQKIGIEFNGIYWHDENHKPQNYHYEKYLAAKQAGIQLIQIWQDDWQNKQEKIIKSLLYKINASTISDKVYARQTKIQSLSLKDMRIFMEANHIQGFASGTHYLALTRNDQPEAAIILKKEPGNTLNIVRYATSAQVIGGFTKLLKYAEREYAPKRFITFADHTISNGGLYENNGFVADKELPPDYMYVIRGERKHKFGYRLKRFRNDPDLIWQEGLSERELALLNNIPRIWDAGKTRYVKEL